ncbi:MAG: TraB/GumN family protein [Methanobrevibacter sp.]|nr:TraB/GumN family protein [Methanobrevibacter sp.]
MFFLNRELLTIIGTAHVSEESVNEVKDAIYEQHPDIVAIELDRGRYIKIRNKMRGVEEDDNIQITRIIKENKVGLFLVSTLLGYFQSKIGAEVDVDPGSEMIGAIEACEDLNIPIALIDREINTTLQRALNKMGFMEKAKFGYGLIASVLGFDDEEEDIDIEDLKNSENIDDMMEMFKDEAPSIYEVLVHERDAYLAGKIMQIPYEHVIAVVGAGHKPGIEKYLDNPETLPNLKELEVINDKKGIPWLKIFLAMIPILFVVIFFLAFFNGINITGNIYEFIVISVIMGFIGSILSGSKIQSAIVGGIVAPLTIIHPLLAAGWFSGLTEAKYRNVRQSDIKNLAKIESLKDLWHNNIFRILLVVIGTNLGVSLATLVILPSKVFIPLFMKIFGG